MATVLANWRWDRAVGVSTATAISTILSFDVEEHFRIEAAVGLDIDANLKAHYCERVETSTRWLLDQLAELDARATFFVVGQLARKRKRLIQDIAEAGHEVASHSWEHRRVHHFTPGEFREDVRKSKDVLEQITGRQVLGYRAPTFSIVRKTAWALDVLAELGFLYDSSIYPVRHDRYGVPAAPRAPFVAKGVRDGLLELPPMTLRVLGMNMPVGGGGYFRLFPLALMERAFKQVRCDCNPAVAMLYFHPWEFDPEQVRLPLGRLSRFRTYAGIRRSRPRLLTLLEGRPLTRAMDVAAQLDPEDLASYSLMGAL